ncbi:MAG: AraC family transcriptional regulator ligand-binding domain-containing protein [Deltaproteobacteria bacterium]|nr:AraC family transcriptional regulator ligand-binding domain-containing protein [Deltaproteobacteria bacterium]
MRIFLKSKPVIAPYRSTHHLRVVIQWAEEHGIDTAPILSSKGLEKADFDNPDRLIKFEQQFEITQKLFDIISCQALGLRIGERINIGQLGKWIMAINSCATAIDAFKMAFALADLISFPFQIILDVQGDIAKFSFIDLIDMGSSSRFRYEMHIVGGYNICCEILRERVQIIEIRFAYPQPEYADEYKKIFNCPIIFDAEETQILFDSSYLTRPLPCANTLTKNIYEKDCHQTIEQLIMLTTTTELAKSALQFKDKELLTRSQLAQRLNMSDQTLKRRLAAEGVNYKSLVQGIREKKARDLLQSTELSMEEIACNLGYSDVANFYRAFKSWTGLTPLSYRSNNTRGGRPRDNRAGA